MAANGHMAAEVCTDMPTLTEPAKANQRMLLVDDNDSIREMLVSVFEEDGFEVTAANNVNDALKCIGSADFDVLLSDLQMPSAGDGLTVASAMRHSNPKTVTCIFSGHPDMDQAVHEILLQTDEVFLKPMAPAKLVEAIRERMKIGAPPVQVKEAVSSILEQESQSTIEDWLRRVAAEPNVITISITPAERSAHLPALFRDLVSRMRNPLPLGTHALISSAAAEHGRLRREQGYSPAMIVEESRMLQVSIFNMLQENLQRVDFSVLLKDVMTIADEVDSQLAQALKGYLLEADNDGVPIKI